MRMDAMYLAAGESLWLPLPLLASSLATSPHQHLVRDQILMSSWQMAYHSFAMTPAKLVALPVPAPPFWGQTLVHLCRGVTLHTSDMLLRQQGIYSHSGYT